MAYYHVFGITHCSVSFQLLLKYRVSAEILSPTVEDEIDYFVISDVENNDMIPQRH